MGLEASVYLLILKIEYKIYVHFPGEEPIEFIGSWECMTVQNP